MNKILGAGLLAAVTAFSANSAVCGNGGFYAGVFGGASFNKGFVKIQKNDLSTKLSSLMNDLVKKYSDASTDDDKNKVLTTYRDAVKDDFESDEALKAVFYKDGKNDAPITGVADFTESMKKYNDGIIATEMSELGIGENGKASKTATGFLFGAMAGFDHRINDFMVGVELDIGMDAGGKAKIKDKKASEGIEVKRQFFASLMPRVGYLVAPQFEVFVKAGGMLGRYKADTSKMLTVFDHAAAFKKMAKAINKTIPDDSAKINTTIYGKDATKVFKNHKKTKFTGLIGGGVRYEITPEMFATLEYEYAFKTKIVNEKTAGADIRMSSHIVKAGFGFRF